MRGSTPLDTYRPWWMPYRGGWSTRSGGQPACPADRLKLLSSSLRVTPTPIVSSGGVRPHRQSPSAPTGPAMGRMPRRCRSARRSGEPRTSRAPTAARRPTSRRPSSVASRSRGRAAPRRHPGMKPLVALRQDFSARARSAWTPSSRTPPPPTSARVSTISRSGAPGHPMKIFTTAHPSAPVALVGGTCTEDAVQMLELGGGGDRPRPARARRCGRLVRTRPSAGWARASAVNPVRFRPSDVMPLRRASRAVARRVAP